MAVRFSTGSVSSAHNHAMAHKGEASYAMHSIGLPGKLSLWGEHRPSYVTTAGLVLEAARRKLTEDLSGVRLYLHGVLDSNTYQFFMATVIVTNTILIIHETDLNAADVEVELWASILSRIFLTIYCLEILLRLYVWRWFFFSDRWNCLDLLVVATDLCIEVINVWIESKVPAVSVLRILRLARMVRLISMLTMFRELQIMLEGFGSAMRAMFWAAVMVGVIITICSLIAVEIIHPLNVEVAKSGVYDGCTRCGNAFATVAEANLTFIQQIVAGDSWGTVTIPIIELYPATALFFFVVLGVVELGVLNLIMTVIVNAAETSREQNIVSRLKQKADMADDMKTKLKQICESLDKDHDGKISLEEFLAGYSENEDFRTSLALLDIQREDCEMLYRNMDMDGSGDVDHREFIHSLIRLKIEPLDTKILVLKQGLQDIKKSLQEQRKMIKQDVVGQIMGCCNLLTPKCQESEPTEKEVVKAELQSLLGKMDQRCADLCLQPDKISAEFKSLQNKIDFLCADLCLQPDKMKAEFQRLQKKIEQRCEQLQEEQAKSSLLLSEVLAEVSAPPSVTASVPPQASTEGRTAENLPWSLPLPASGEAQPGTSGFSFRPGLPRMPCASCSGSVSRHPARHPEQGDWDMKLGQ